MNDEQALQAVGQRIIEFLDAALKERIPERDIEVSRGIMADLIAILPKEEPGWTEGIEKVATIVANALKGRASEWGRALHLGAIYFSASRLGTNPVRLAISITRALLMNGSSSERLSFFAGIDDWDVLRSLASALPSIELTTVELAVFLQRADEFTRRDMTRGEVFDAIHAWAGAHGSIAQDVVDRWLRREPEYRDLETSSIAVLVEGIVAVDSSKIEWRNDVIKELVHRRDESSWQLAALLACFAWPEENPPSVIERHDELCKHVERLPERMVFTGLTAMWRDAKVHPAESVKTALKLLTTLPDQSHDQGIETQLPLKTRLALALLEVAKRAIWSIQQSTDSSTVMIDWTSVVEVLIPVPPRYARGLDGYLKDLAKNDLPITKSFLMRWLEAHRDELHAQYSELEHLFPRLTQALWDQLPKWLMEMAVSPRRHVRFLAISLLDGQNMLPEEEALSSLSSVQARALAHGLAASNTSGEFWIPMLFDLGRACPGAMAEITDILLKDAVIDYPGVCRNHLASWSEPATSHLDREHARALGDAGQQLEDRLSKQEHAHACKCAVPEIVTMIPAMDWGLAASQRNMQMADERIRASGQFSFLSRLQQVPIARGQGTAHRVGDQVMHVPFAELSQTFEMSFLDAVDPAWMIFRRRVHQQKADELLRTPGRESEP